MTVIRRIVLAVAGATLVGACSASVDTGQVDGWATGGFIAECTTSLDHDDCARVVPPALRSIADDRPVRTVKVYEEGPYIDASGSPHRVDRGAGPVVVVVATYEDGSRHAAGVYCGPAASGSVTAACSVVRPPYD